MANDFVVTLTDVELKALQYVAYDPNDWIQNAVHERCRLAMDEMVSIEVSNRLNAGLPISGTKEEIVLASTLPNAKERHEAKLQEMAALVPTNPG